MFVFDYILFNNDINPGILFVLFIHFSTLFLYIHYKNTTILMKKESIIVIEIYNIL